MHYLVLVVGRPEDLFEKLDPFDANKEVDSFISRTRKEVIDDCRFWVVAQLTDPKSVYNQYKNNPETAKVKLSLTDSDIEDFNSLPSLVKISDDDMFWEKIPNIYKEDLTLDEMGNELSTFNPKSKWDWYELGGRWAGYIKLKDTVSYEDYALPNFSWGWSEKTKAINIASGGVDFARIKDIDNLDKLTAHAILDADEIWEDEDDFKMESKETDADTIDRLWKEHVQDKLKSLNQDEWITVVDIHI